MIVFLTHIWNPAIGARFKKLHDETAGLMPCRLLLQDDRDQEGRGPVFAEWVRYLAEHGLSGTLSVFDESTLRQDLGLDYLGGDSMVLGSAHYPLMRFAQDCDARYFWMIENDVEYTGSWRDFFSAFAESDADLLAAHLVTHQQDPEWFWWPWLRTPDGNPLDPRKCQKAFLPVYRISARALSLLHALQRQGWNGHFEELLPTLLTLNGFAVRDLRDFADCYVGTAIEPWQRTSTWSSHRWRPSISDSERKALSRRTPPCLLHPIKDEPKTGAAFISVVMTTCNGAARLGGQLASLEAQTRPPDEIIILDDASDDATWDTLVKFVKASRLRVRIDRQPHRSGYVKNFSDALDLAVGDLLLFCDQDGIWREDKISVMEEAFAEGGYDVVTHDIRIFDDEADDEKRWCPSLFGYLDELGLPEDVYVRGHAQGIRASFLRRWGWPPPEGFSPDVWPALVSTLIGTRGYTHQVLAEHRPRGGNVAGWLPSHQDLRLLTADQLCAGVMPGEVMLDMLLADDRQHQLDTLNAVLTTSGSVRHREALSIVAGYRSRQL